MDIWTLNLRHLRAALHVATLGSISAAAQAVALTQPAVTQGLARLERQLGHSLFDRRTDGMSPTPAMLTLAPRIARALDHIASPRVTMAQLRALLALAAAGSYAGAAVASGLSEPSLHRAIKDLGVALRRTLVERRGRGIGLTEAGHRTVRAFRLARTELAAGLGELANLGGREIGRIAVGAMPLSRARVLPAAVTRFLRTHPEVEISISEGSHSELIEPLRDGELDLLIGALRTPSPGNDITQTPLFDDHPAIFARAGHPLAGSRPSLSALAGCAWVIAGIGTPLRAQWEKMFMDAKRPLPAVPIESGSVMTIRQLLRDSDYLTLLSRDQLTVELEAGLLVELCPAPVDVSRTIGITTRTDWQPTSLQKAFLDTLVEAAELSKTYRA